MAFNAKIKDCGLFFDKVLKKYTAKPAEDTMGNDAKKEQGGGK